MPRTLPQPDPPRLRQISGDLSVLVRLVGVDPGRHGRSTPCVDALRSIVEIFELQLQLELDGDSSTHGVVPSDRENLSEVGRCRSAGCQPHGCGCQADRDVLAASPHSGTAPPPHGMRAIAVAPAVASAGARAQPCRKIHIKKQQAGACCFGVMVRPERFELPTAWFVARYSIQLSYGRQLLKLVVLIVCGAPGEIRTPDRLVRSQVLYPTELRARGTQSNFTALPAADAEGLSSGAPGEIRTPDRLVRSQVLYPTELRAPCDRSGIMRMSARVVNAFVKIFTQLNEKRLCDSLRVFHPREVIGLRTQLLRRKHA